MFIDRRLIKNFDYPLFLLVIAICIMGALVLYSATRGMVPDPFHYVRRHVIFLAAGIIVMLLICFVDYINFGRMSRYLFAANLVLLSAILIPGLGKTQLGATRWIPIGFFDLQPSEIAKLIMIIVFAKLLADKEGKLEQLSDLAPALAAALIPVILIFFQPDLGTAMVFGVLLIGMLYVAGVKIRHLLIIGGAALAAAPLFWFFLLRDYQKARLLVFMDHNLDPTNLGYQLNQSMIGIGSGGLLGKGLFESTQVRLQFLPEHYTDFIFSVLGEELGFVGAAIILVLFFFLIYRILWIGAHAKDRFGTLLCSGVAIMLAFQVLVNVGMTISIMPVTGLPLPFVSYGNNALLVNLMAIGLVLNVSMRRYKIQF